MSWLPYHGLYPYQNTASASMQGRNTLLAFEMGCGKTPTTLHAIEHQRTSSDRQAIIVTPSSLKWQWASEVLKFTDQARVVIDGDKRARLDQYSMARDVKPGYVIMSYDSFVRDWEYVKALGGHFLVLDEATAIKSFATKRSKHIKKVAYRYPVRYALTGTPIENGKLEEIFSIMEFVDRKVLGPWKLFDPYFIDRNSMGWIEGYRNVPKLHARLKNTKVMQRATHRTPEVAKYLPKVTTMPTLTVQLSRKARQFHDAVADLLLADLDKHSAERREVAWDRMWKEDWDHPDGRMMAKITVLRQFLSWPESVLASNSKFVIDLIRDGVIDDDFPPDPDKLEAVRTYLLDFMSVDSGKAIVFTSFVATAIQLHSMFPAESVILHGGMRSKQREESISRFKNDSSVRLFISTDAGGYGLDFPEANLVVNYDLPWSPGLLGQRNARIRRASSLYSHVLVQNVVTEQTLDERLLAMLLSKAHLAGGVLDGDEELAVSGVVADHELSSVVGDLDTLRGFLSNQQRKR